MKTHNGDLAVLMIVTLYMTMESRTDTINFWQLVKEIKKSNKFEQEHIKDIEEKLNGAKPIWLKIKTLRCSQFAHNNFDLSIDGVFGKASIKPNEFKEFISQLGKIINYITRIHNNSSHAFNSDHRYSTRQFMDYILKQENSAKRKT